MNSNTLSKITVDIQASPDHVWEIMRDMPRWSEWTASITSVRPIGAGPLAEGSRVHIRQPGLPAANWRITGWQEGRGFQSVSTAPGLRVTAEHWIEATENGSHVALSVQYSGLFGPLVARLTRGLNERYIAMEADGLKRRCETG